MKRLKSAGIILLGTVGFVIMPSDSVMQAAIGLAMLSVAVWWGSRGNNWRQIYRMLILINKKLGFETNNKELND
jgi:hypothetical protein